MFVELYSGHLGACGCAGSASVCLSVYECVRAEPNPVIEAFTKSARTKNKLLMQDKVDQPVVGYLDLETEFHLQCALITWRPWLTPCLPIIIVHGATN